MADYGWIGGIIAALADTGLGIAQASKGARRGQIATQRIPLPKPERAARDYGLRLLVANAGKVAPTAYDVIKSGFTQRFPFEDTGMTPGEARDLHFVGPEGGSIPFYDTSQKHLTLPQALFIGKMDYNRGQKDTIPAKMHALRGAAKRAKDVLEDPLISERGKARAESEYLRTTKRFDKLGRDLGIDPTTFGQIPTDGLSAAGLGSTRPMRRAAASIAPHDVFDIIDWVQKHYSTATGLQDFPGSTPSDPSLASSGEPYATHYPTVPGGKIQKYLWNRMPLQPGYTYDPGAPDVSERQAYFQNRYNRAYAQIANTMRHARRGDLMFEGPIPGHRETQFRDPAVQKALLALQDYYQTPGLVRGPGGRKAYKRGAVDAFFSTLTGGTRIPGRR